jgi:acetolactate synthase-1/2/3 large subunit
MARAPADLLRLVPAAFRLALSGRPGPVLIDLPKDVQRAELAVDLWPEPGCAMKLPLPGPAHARQAAAMIRASERPLLYVGGGVVSAGAGGLARKLSEHLDAPVALTLMGLGALDPGHPNYLGMMGMHAAEATNLALEECDLLLALGARFDDRATGKLSQFCPDAKVVHVDLDARELGKLRRPEVAIHAGVAETLELLLRECAPQARPAWRRRVAELKAARGFGPPEHGSVAALLHACARALPGALVSTDVGQHQMWTAQHYPFRRERGFISSGGLGTMGFGLPAALGAAMADPSRPALCVTGDGSLLMNVQELATLAESGADVKILLLDNASLGLVHQQQDLFFGGRRYASEFGFNPDWMAVARAFGMPGHDLGDLHGPWENLGEILQAPGPALIRAPLGRQAKVWPMVPPGGANRDMLLGEREGSAA